MLKTITLVVHRSSLKNQCIPVSLRSLQTGTVNVEGRLIQRPVLLSSAVGKSPYNHLATRLYWQRLMLRNETSIKHCQRLLVKARNRISEFKPRWNPYKYHTGTTVIRLLVCHKVLNPELSQVRLRRSTWRQHENQSAGQLKIRKPNTAEGYTRRLLIPDFLYRFVQKYTEKIIKLFPLF